MEVIKKKDFVEIEYTGKLKEEDAVFDTTDEETAKQNEIHNPNAKYGPIIVCIGEGHLLKGLETFLEGKEPGKEYTIGLSPEEGFGKKDAKLIQLMPTNKFKQQNIDPMPGLQINIDGTLGIIKTVSGGRTLVDFNNPLAGKELTYKIKPIKIIDNDKEKAEALIKLNLNINDVDLELKEGEINLKLSNELPENTKKELEKNIKELIPSIKSLKITKEEKKVEIKNK